MKTLLLLFISTSVLAQVSINPTSVGVGQSTISSIPLHINGGTNTVKLESQNPAIIISQHADPTNTQHIIKYDTSPSANFSFNSYSGIYTFYTQNQEQGRINDNTNQMTLQAEARFNKLIFNGPMRFNNNAGASGDVLYSFGNGTPLWGGVTPKEPVGFGAVSDNFFTIASGVEVDFTSLTQEFDTPADLDFFPVTGAYIVPSNGVYHFDAAVPIINHNSTITDGRATLYIKKNGVIIDSMLKSFSGYGAVNQTLTQVHLSTTLKLVAGDIIKFGIVQVNNLNQNISIGASSAQWQKNNVSGFKVY